MIFLQDVCRNPSFFREIMTYSDFCNRFVGQIAAHSQSCALYSLHFIILKRLAAGFGSKHFLYFDEMMSADAILFLLAKAIDLWHNSRGDFILKIFHLSKKRAYKDVKKVSI